MRRYSVLEGFTVSRLTVSQEWTLSRVEERMDRLWVKSEAEKDM